MNTFIYKIVSDIDNLSYNVVQLLKMNSIQLSVAESCTGGGISAALTGISGSSEVFGFGLCAYANNTKEKYLNVKPDSLKRYGAVSKQVALEMARGARTAGIAVSGLGYDDGINQVMGISTTGIAGPGGGSAEKPVGTVHFACVFRGTEKHLHLEIKPPDFIGNDMQRHYIRMEAIRQALILCKDMFN